MLFTIHNPMQDRPMFPPDAMEYRATCRCYNCRTYFELRDDQEEGRQYECPECEAETVRQECTCFTCGGPKTHKDSEVCYQCRVDAIEYTNE